MTDGVSKKAGDRPGWPDKIAVWIIIAILIMIPAVASYYAGICHAIEDSEVYYNRRGEIIIELDGQAYVHFLDTDEGGF